MTKIKLLRSPGPLAPGLAEGQITEVDDGLAEALCQRNLAEVVGKPTLKAVPSEPLKGVPPAEEGTVEKAEDDFRNYSQKHRKAKAANGE